MPITPFLNGERFDSEVERVLRVAFEIVSITLRTGDSDDYVNQAIATKLIALVKAGERNPDTLCDEVLKDIHTPQQWAASEAARSSALEGQKARKRNTEAASPRCLGGPSPVFVVQDTEAGNLVARAGTPSLQARRGFPLGIHYGPRRRSTDLEHSLLG